MCREWIIESIVSEEYLEQAFITANMSEKEIRALSSTSDTESLESDSDCDTKIPKEKIKLTKALSDNSSALKRRTNLVARLSDKKPTVLTKEQQNQ